MAGEPPPPRQEVSRGGDVVVSEASMKESLLIVQGSLRWPTTVGHRGSRKMS